VQPVGSDPDPVTCSAVVTGAATVVNTTLIVGSGETFDGHCQRFVAGSAIAFASDVPLFRMEDGARLINVVLGSPAADGIHTYGNASLSNVTWQDVGEDALTINARGTVEIDGGSASRADDTVFKINAPGTLRVSEFRARDALKFIRQDASMTAAAELFIDRCDISGMSEAIARTDTSASHVTMTDTRYSAIGGALFMGFSPLNVITSGNSRY
jgi:pectate lyase C